RSDRMVYISLTAGGHGVNDLAGAWCEIVKRGPVSRIGERTADEGLGPYGGGELGGHAFPSFSNRSVCGERGEHLAAYLFPPGAQRRVLLRGGGIWPHRGSQFQHD